MKNQKTVFRHFKNNFNKGDVQGFGMIADLISKVPVIQGSIELVPMPTITVAGIIGETTSAKHLKIGVSRGSDHDAFSRKKGRAYSEWRANNGSVMDIMFHIDTPDDFIYNVFQDVAETTNRHFIPMSSVDELVKIPDHVLIKETPKVVEKTVWTEEMINRARAEKNQKMINQDTELIAAHG